MGRFLLARLGHSALAILCVLVLVFLLVRLTGDPAVVMLPQEATAAEVAAFREAMGFDRPLAVQFWEFLSRAAVGDFGKSLHYRISAWALVMERLPATLELAVAALGFAVAVAVPLGILAATRPGSAWDAAAQAVALLGQAIPAYWAGLILILLLAVQLGLLPVAGRSGWGSLVMPMLTMAMGVVGRLTQLARSVMGDALRQDYVRTAHSKGLGAAAVYYRHALKNAAIPLITMIGVNFGYMLGGSVLIESVFAWPGIGRLAAQAVFQRDFPLVQAVAFFGSLVVLTVNLVTDLVYGWVNPQIRHR
ncbi:MAG TPA: ABC transporter permease [Methylomirabilota bacterium]|nr:ABC transporter permease [Methylomirabilota bacterium]